MGVQFHNHPDFTRNLLAQINPEVVNEKKTERQILGTVFEALYLAFPGEAVGVGTFGAGLFFIRFIISLQKNFIPPNREMWIMKDVQGLQLFG